MEKSSKRERSREKSKSVKRNRKRSRDDTEEKKPVKAANSGMHRRRIRWVHDDRMFKTRFFKINDEPIADGLSDAQMRDFRDRLLREATIQASSQTASRSV